MRDCADELWYTLCFRIRRPFRSWIVFHLLCPESDAKIWTHKDGTLRAIKRIPIPVPAGDGRITPLRGGRFERTWTTGVHTQHACRWVVPVLSPFIRHTNKRNGFYPKFLSRWGNFGSVVNTRTTRGGSPPAESFSYPVGELSVGQLSLQGVQRNTVVREGMAKGWEVEERTAFSWLHPNGGAGKSSRHGVVRFGWAVSEACPDD